MRNDPYFRSGSEGVAILRGNPGSKDTPFAGQIKSHPALRRRRPRNVLSVKRPYAPTRDRRGGKGDARQSSYDRYVAHASWTTEPIWRHSGAASATRLPLWYAMRHPFARRSENGPDARRHGYVSPMPLDSRRDSVAVLFDLDGTLIDSIELILNSARYAFEKRTRTCPSDAEWLDGVGIPLATMFARYAMDPSDTTAFIDAYREYQSAHHDRLVRCYAGVVETVRGLHEQGHPLAVVTSKSDRLALRGLSYVGLAQYMATIVGTESSTRHKPDPEPVRVALERVARVPENAVFVGDSVHDMEAGNAAGVTTVAALWGPFSRSQLAPSRPDYYLDRISELPALLASLGA